MPALWCGGRKGSTTNLAHGAALIGGLGFAAGRAPKPAGPQDPEPSPGVAARLQGLKELHATGQLTDPEFTAAKRRQLEHQGRVASGRWAQANVSELCNAARQRRRRLTGSVAAAPPRLVLGYCCLMPGDLAFRVAAA